MKYWHAFIIYLVAFICQPFLYGLLPTLGIDLNLILCLTVVLTLVYEDRFPGLFFGPIFGLLSDCLYAPYVGPEAFAIAIVGVLVFILREYINIENVLNAIFILIASTWLFVSVLWCVYYLIGSTYSYMAALHELPIQIILNTIVGIVIYRIVIKRVIRHRRDRYFR